MLGVRARESRGTQAGCANNLFGIGSIRALICPEFSGRAGQGQKEIVPDTFPAPVKIVDSTEGSLGKAVPPANGVAAVTRRKRPAPP